MGILDFIFGKNPDIFDDKGNVVHQFPKRKWDAWINRMKTDPQYNWRNHTGTQSGRSPQKDSAKTPSKS